MFQIKYHSEIPFVMFYLAFCKPILMETRPETNKKGAVYVRFDTENRVKRLQPDVNSPLSVSSPGLVFRYNGFTKCQIKHDPALRFHTYHPEVWQNRWCIVECKIFCSRAQEQNKPIMGLTAVYDTSKNAITREPLYEVKFNFFFQTMT